MPDINLKLCRTLLVGDWVDYIFNFFSLNSSKQVIPRILQAVENLAKNPYSSDSKKLVGSDSIYRICVGDYRIIYNIESSILTIEIIKVGHRREIYRQR